jgi:hypothetical protein
VARTDIEGSASSVEALTGGQIEFVVVRQAPHDRPFEVDLTEFGQVCACVRAPEPDRDTGAIGARE